LAAGSATGTRRLAVGPFGRAAAATTAFGRRRRTTARAARILARAGLARSAARPAFLSAAAGHRRRRRFAVAGASRRSADAGDLRFGAASRVLAFRRAGQNRSGAGRRRRIKHTSPAARFTASVDGVSFDLRTAVLPAAFASVGVPPLAVTTVRPLLFPLLRAVPDAYDGATDLRAALITHDSARSVWIALNTEKE